jgi:hypothetical protein
MANFQLKICHEDFKNRSSPHTARPGPFSRGLRPPFFAAAGALMKKFKAFDGTLVIMSGAINFEESH